MVVIVSSWAMTMKYETKKRPAAVADEVKRVPVVAVAYWEMIRSPETGVCVVNPGWFE